MSAKGRHVGAVGQGCYHAHAKQRAGCTATNPPAHTQLATILAPTVQGAACHKRHHHQWCVAGLAGNREGRSYTGCFRPPAAAPPGPANVPPSPPRPLAHSNPLRPVLLHCSNARWRGHQPSADGRQRVPEARQRAAAHPARPCGQQQWQQRAAAMMCGVRPIRGRVPLLAPRCAVPLGLQSGMNS